ncbi:Pro-neuregulin-2, membrane-bound isoform [Anabarilius grahami]|uniref:Pro-neuregulin-2, membrane-bound isoform n=1 Tax=Anabarilius grahami TaxID=495550 RepID=A0A3N0XLP2_ANAGA|nr:Pro-neuregulin-2, membrane-bound isoform [Anabarilius grahami]
MREISYRNCRRMREREQQRRKSDRRRKDGPREGKKRASAPKVKPMDSQWLLEGKKLTLKCEAVGNPSPSFNWYKDGSQLRKRKDVKIKSNKDAKTFEVGEATFTKMTITHERNEIFSPNYQCKSSFCGRVEKKDVLRLATLTGKKHENGYHYFTVNRIDLKIGIQCLCPRRMIVC